MICGGSNLQAELYCRARYNGELGGLSIHLGENKVLAGDLTNGLIVLDASRVGAAIEKQVRGF